MPTYFSCRPFLIDKIKYSQDATKLISTNNRLDQAYFNAEKIIFFDLNKDTNIIFNKTDKIQQHAIQLTKNNTSIVSLIIKDLYLFNVNEQYCFNFIIDEIYQDPDKIFFAREEHNEFNIDQNNIEAINSDVYYTHEEDAHAPTAIELISQAGDGWVIKSMNNE